MNIDDVKTFLVVADCTSFPQAAERLYVSPSTISRRIKSLEAELGTELVAQSRKALLLTGAGRALLGKARTLAEAHDDFLDAARSLDQNIKHTLCIAHESLSYEQELLAATLPLLRTQFPQLTVIPTEKEPDALVQSLETKEADVALTFRELLPESDRFVVHEFAVTTTTVLFAKGHRLAQRTHINPSDLSGECLIAAANSCARLANEQHLGALMKAGARNMHVKYVGEHREAFVMASAGEGFVSAMPWIANPLPKSLARVPFAPGTITATPVAVWLRECESPEITRFVELAHEHLAAAFPSWMKRSRPPA